MTADEYSSISPTNLADLFIQIDKVQRFNLNIFYDNYITHLTSNQSPLILTREIIIDPIKLLPQFLGKTLNFPQRAYIQNNFALNVCLDSPDCYLRINRTIEKLEKASSIKEFYNNSEKYKNLYPEILSWQKAINLYSFNSSCSKNLIDLKERIDQYLFSNQFPLTLDLSYPNWNTPLPPPKILEDESDREIYNIYTQSIFDSNDNFSPPNYLEIGLLYGILKDLCAYNYQN